jgi:hypothetical protein
LIAGRFTKEKSKTLNYGREINEYAGKGIIIIIIIIIIITIIYVY